MAVSLEGLGASAVLIGKGVATGDVTPIREGLSQFVWLAARNMGKADTSTLRRASAMLIQQLNAAAERPVSDEVRFMLGAVWSLKMLFDTVCSQQPSHEELNVVIGRKHASDILQCLLKFGVCSASELALRARVSRDQVASATRPLIAAGIVQVTCRSKYRFYSLTGRGLVTAEHLTNRQERSDTESRAEREDKGQPPGEVPETGNPLDSHREVAAGAVIPADALSEEMRDLLIEGYFKPAAPESRREADRPSKGVSNRGIARSEADERHLVASGGRKSR